MSIQPAESSNSVRREVAFMRWMAFAWLMLCTGCAVSPSGSLTLFPEGHPLTESAAEVAQREPFLPLPRELGKQPLPPYVVEPGDALAVEVDSPNETVFLPGDFPVIQDGTIDLGIYGRPIVAWKTREEIEAIVRAAIEPHLEGTLKSVTVRITERNSKVYYVLGEVVQPGSYPLIGGETVLDGILTAGGLTDATDGETIILTRPTPPESCRIVLPVCWDQIVQLGDTTTNYQLMPGDRIFVATRSFRGLCASDEDGLCQPPQYGCPLGCAGDEVIPLVGPMPPARVDVLPAPTPVDLQP